MKILKAVFAGIFITIICGISVVVANTATISEENANKIEMKKSDVVRIERVINKKGNEKYEDCYSGTGGYYSVSGRENYTTLRIVNTSRGLRLFDYYVKRYNYSTRSYDLIDSNKTVTTPGQNLYPGVRRGTDGNQYNYIHCANRYPSQYEVNLEEIYIFTVRQQ